MYKMDINVCKPEDSISLFTGSNENKTYDINNLVAMARGTETSNLFEISENIEPSGDADDILRNGILVETNRGVVCMSLKDVLSSNLNLSVEDFKKVAAQLLSQEDIPKSANEINTKLEINGSTNEIQLTVSQFHASDVEMKFDPVAPPPVSKLLILPKVEKFNTDATSKESNKQESVLLTNFQNNEIILNSYYDSFTHGDQFQSNSTPTSEAVDTSEETDKEKTNIVLNVAAKRRGGWPKGRKRKPELLNLPPKAPKTSYNIFLNERRKLYKDKLAFHEITRVVGNQWSNLTAEEKRPYIERAEEDKKRYREELRIYRQSDAYKLYLARKRKKRAMDNLMSESDMDGTDDIDDEENDMLYCDTCDQWFYNLHNKREHLQSRQHKMTVVGDMNRNLASSDSENKGHTSSVSFSTSLDESSMDAAPLETNNFPKKNASDTDSVYDNMVQLIGSVSKREKEIEVLSARLQEAIAKQNSYLSELHSLKNISNSLKTNLIDLKHQEISLEQQLIRLWNVPSLFVINTVECVN